MRSATALRSTAMAVVLLIGLASCSSEDAATPGTANGPEGAGRSAQVAGTDKEPMSLSSLDGTWSVAIGEPSVEATSGLQSTATVTAELQGNMLAMAWEGTSPSGASRTGSSTQAAMFTGEIDLECSNNCVISQTGGPPGLAIDEVDGQLRIVSMATGEPPARPCFDAPDGAWDVTVLDDSTLEILDAISSGSGGDDGCQDAVQIVYTMTLTRSG